MTQPTLFEHCTEDSIDRRFCEFHAANPEIYNLLVRFARQAKASGKNRIGIRLLYERARWELWINALADEEYRLNNNYASRYARLIMALQPDLANMFETRRLRAA